MPFSSFRKKNFHVFISLRACGPGMVSKARFAHIHRGSGGAFLVPFRIQSPGVLGVSRRKLWTWYLHVAVSACVSNVATLDICLAERPFPSETTLPPKSPGKQTIRPPHPLLFLTFVSLQPNSSTSLLKVTCVWIMTIRTQCYLCSEAWEAANDRAPQTPTAVLTCAVLTRCFQKVSGATW